MENEELQKVPMNQIGVFYSNKVHLVYYTYQKQSSLYTWMEGMVYVWVGANVKTDKEKLLKEVRQKMSSIGTIQNVVGIL